MSNLDSFVSNEVPEYVKTLWQPHIIDPVTGDVISEGTRFTSTRANNFEEGIYVNRELHKKFFKKLLRLETELEIGNRVPGGNAFFDTGSGNSDDVKGLDLQTANTYVKDLSTGNTIEVADSSEFEVGRYYVIYDDEIHEHVKITKIDGNKITLDKSLTAKKGAKLCSTNIKIKEGFSMDYWTNIIVKGEII